MFGKKLPVMASAALLSLSLAGSASAQGVTTTLDGRILTFDQPALMQQGRVMVPLRGIFEALGADVVYDAGSRTIKATKADRVVELTLGSQNARINGQPSYLDVPAGTIGGRTMVPLRFVSESLGADVKWNAASRTVALSSTGGDLQDGPVVTQPQQPVATDVEIDNVIHNARGNLGVGDRLVVTATGTPGARATFDLLGVVSGIPMTEVSSGRYEGTLMVQHGMTANRGTLVVRMSKNGREAVQESNRAVSINSNNNNNNNPATGSLMNPAQGSIVNTSRPTIQVRMGNNIVPGTARLLVDGQEISAQSTVVGDQITLIPYSDLPNGFHRVTVNATDVAGRLLTQSWDFQVAASGYPYTPGVGTNQVMITNLASGAQVPGVFNVIGQTLPYATVTINAQANRQLIPGVIGFQDRLGTVTRQADAMGRFDIQLDVSRVPVNTPLILDVQSTDPQGRTTSPTRLEVTRR